jgi:Uma2 family endonuclease
MTVEEYLEFDRASEFRHEYYKGWVWRVDEPPVSPASPIEHEIIVSRLLRSLASHGGERDVPVAPSRIVADLGVVEQSGLVLTIEVVSPSSEAEDRGVKAAQYRTIATIQEYAFVSQAEARVEVYRGQEGGHWLLSEFAGLKAAARFDSVNASVPLAEIYDKITFGDECADAPSHPAD